MKKPFTGNDGIDVRFWCRGWNAMGGFNLKKTQVDKKLSDLLQNPRPLPQGTLAPGRQPVFFHEPIP